VLTDDGVMLDVTPHNTEGDFPFLQHAGTEHEFLAASTGPMDLKRPGER
jgi:hypothetical protein